MTVSTGKSAENFWEDGYEDEADCEKFLQEQKTKIIEDEEEHGVTAEYDEDAEDEEDEDEDEQDSDGDYDDGELVAEGDEDADEEDAEDEEDIETDEDPVAEAEEDEAEATSHEEGKKMSKTKAKTGGKTKAEAIREVINRRKKAGESLRPRDIIEELSANGFEVNASQVSVTLRSMGVPAAPRGRAKGTKVAKPAAEAEPKSRVALKRGVGEPSHDGAGDAASMVDMAVDFLHAAGGYAKAVELLDSISRVTGA